MNFLPVVKLRRLVTRVVPSTIVTKLRFSFRRRRQVKDQDIELQRDDISWREDQQQRQLPISSREAGISIIEEIKATAAVKVGSPPVENRISSSESDSIEEVLRPPGEARSSVKKVSQTVISQDHPTHQHPLQQDVDEIVSLPLEGEGVSGEPGGFVIEHLGKEASSSSAPRRQAERVSIEMGSEDADEQRNPTYVETYLNFMFTCGLSPFLPEGASGGFWSYCQAFCFIQVIVYWVITISTILDSMAIAKHACIEFAVDGGNLEDLTNMGYHIMDVFLKTYSAYLFTLQQHKFAKMLKSMARLRRFAKQYGNVKEEKYEHTRVIILAIVSMTISILNVIFAVGLLKWTPENFILHYSYKLGVALYIWTPAQYGQNATGLSAIYNEYGLELTKEKVIMGVVYAGIRFCNRAMANAVGDIILSTAATIQKQMFGLAKDVGNPDNDIFPITLETFEAPGGQWQHYQLLKEAVDDTNDTFDSLLKYIHVDNMMLVVYIIMNVFDADAVLFGIIHLLYNIMKAILSYRIATKASEKNAVYRQWIRRLIMRSNDPLFIAKAHAILDQLKENPIGLGKGQFLIDENFLFRFVGGAGSVFVLQAQAREANPAAT